MAVLDSAVIAERQVDRKVSTLNGPCLWWMWGEKRGAGGGWVQPRVQLDVVRLHPVGMKLSRPILITSSRHIMPG